MSDISFLKTQPNQTDLKIQLSFHSLVFEKQTSTVWGEWKCRISAF